MQALFTVVMIEIIAILLILIRYIA